jgi:hypothetical protein
MRIFDPTVASNAVLAVTQLLKQTHEFYLEALAEKDAVIAERDAAIKNLVERMNTYRSDVSAAEGK